MDSVIGQIEPIQYSGLVRDDTAGEPDLMSGYVSDLVSGVGPAW